MHMIETWHVRDALRPRLGSALVDEPGFLDGITHTLRSFAPYKDTFASMAARLEEDLFNLLYERLGHGHVGHNGWRKNPARPHCGAEGRSG